MIVTTKINLDTLRQNTIPIIWGKMGDKNSRQLQIALLAEGIPQPIPVSAAATLQMRRSDGNSRTAQGAITADGNALIILPEWLFEIDGLAECALSIKESCCKLTSLSFQVYIQEGTFNNDGQIVYYLTAGNLNPGTYTIYIGNIPYTFTTTQIIPTGSVIVFSDDYTSATIYQDSNFSNIVESGITVKQEDTGTELPAGDLFNNLFSEINALKQDSTSKSYVDDLYLALESQIARLEQKATTFSDGLEFTSNEDGTCYVSGIGTCTDTEIYIPPISPAGDRVTAIGPSAFALQEQIISITIPSTIEEIGNTPFYGCFNLRAITLYPENPPAISSPLTFEGTYPLYVSSYTLDTYLHTQYWSELESRLVAFTDGVTIYWNKFN